MLFRAVLLGLVLTSFVLALPTVREEAALERNELNELETKNENRRAMMDNERREERRDSNEPLDRNEESLAVEEERREKERRGSDEQRKTEERREAAREEQRRREAEQLKDAERRETMEKKDKKEERRETMEKKDEERREAEQRRRETEEKKDEQRRETMEKKDKKEERRETEEKKDEERRETEEKKDKKEERRETEEKEQKRREKEEKKEEKRREKEEKKEEERREAEEKEQKRREKEEKKEEKRREKEEKKEERRSGTEEMKKDNERRETEEKKDEERRETEEKKDKKEERREAKEEQRRREAEQRRRETEEKKDEQRRETEQRRRETEEKKDEQRRETEEKKDKKEERRETEEKKDEERRETEEKEQKRREKEEKKEEKRREKEEKEQKRRESKESEREKRRPTPAIKGEKRDSMSNLDEEKKQDEEKLDRRDANGNPLTICESVTDFKYFQKIEDEPTKYIQCDPWGTGKIKTCAEGLFWNEWTLVCDLKENIRNMTLDLSKFSVTTAARPVVNCTLVGMECLNGGQCVQAVSGDYKCACRTDFTGQFCESRVDLTDITHEILNSTFSVLDYRRHLQLENLTMNMAYYEKFKDQLDNVTYTELMRYLGFYKDGEVRYDTLVNSLVEDILENIYPDAEYLSVFNATEQNVVQMVQMIPSLLSYSRYSFERYEDVFAQYQHVLTSLSKLLNTTLPTVREEATQYTVLTRIFLNQTMALVNSVQDHSLVDNTPTDQPIQLTEADIKKALQYNYNETLKATEQLIKILETFQNSVVKELQTNPGGVITLTLGQAKFPGATEMLAVLNQVSAASTQIWESLVNYGFWYLTNLFSETTKVDSIKYSLNLNKF